ncbi:MAG: isopeptide-forming domain-containing fimbrial protein [Oscillospiraceae bacterium]|nr:isopeptide-forming domain-containing fimbrial protein [Oscillospiraceae bacterium]
MKRLFAIALAIVMIMALAVPAMAADPVNYSITIDHPDATVNHTYEAYQIFTGTLDASGTKLSNVQWGTGINSTALLTALDDDGEWGSHVSPATTAAELADVLAAATTTTTMVETFRTAAGANLTGTIAASTNTAVAGKYVLNLDAAGAGYYLVKDKDGSLENTHETYTNYILRVVGKDTLHPKGGKTTVDKVIVDGGSAKEAADYSVGDTVHFRVTGTLPANYTAFSQFYYEFSDKMSAGLTYTADSVKVYIENHGVKTILENPTTGTPYYTVTHDAVANTLSVKFEDLMNVAKVAGRTIDASSILIMEYDAVLNENAELGQPGNRNDAQIIFSNDPYSGGHGKTPWDYAWAFTWKLDVSKTDDLGNSLANAKFRFYRESMGTKQYVILDAAKKVDGWTTDPAAATVIVSEKDEVMPIIGLEADTYYLEEIAAPDGYNLLDAPVPVMISATLGAPDTSGGYTVTELTVKFGTADTADGNKDTGVVAGTVVNKSGSVLPETGGMGTTLFYILGGFMVVGAAVLLVTKKRMAV